MAKYEHCIYHNKKTYCWNTETEQIEEINTKPVAIAHCPAEVIVAIMSKMGRELNTANAARRKEKL